MYHVSQISRPLTARHGQVLEDERLGDVDRRRAARGFRTGRRCRRGARSRTRPRSPSARRTSRRRRPCRLPRSAPRTRPGTSSTSATLTTASAPSWRARSSRYGTWSEASSRPAPNARAIAIANSPTGPQPSTAIARPARSCVDVAKTALPNGSWRHAICGGSFARSFCQTTEAGIAAKSAKPPSRSTPRICVRSHMCALPGAAVEAHPAGDVALRGDVVALRHAVDALPHRDDGAAELVAQRQRRLDALGRPLIPALDVEVGAADARRLDPDENLVRARCGNGDLVQDEPLLGTPLPHGAHRLHGETILPRRTRRAARDRELGGSQQSMGSPPGSRQGLRKRPRGYDAAVERSEGRSDPQDTPTCGREDDDRRASGLELESRALVEEERRHAAYAHALGERAVDERVVVEIEVPAARRPDLDLGRRRAPCVAMRRAVPVDEGDELGGAFSTEDCGERKAVDSLTGVEQRLVARRGWASCTPPAEGEPSSASPSASIADEVAPQRAPFSDPPGGPGSTRSNRPSRRSRRRIA